MRMRKYIIFTIIPILISLSIVLIFDKINKVNKQIEEIIHRKNLSCILSDELRQSSYDLTRMVGTYSLSGKARYKEYFQQTLDIRDGLSPRPDVHYKVLFRNI